jgi:acetyltransferase-like isoleucine patch superfamily enzyme
MATVILGNGGHARDIQALTGYPMIPHHTEWDGETPYIIGINDPHLRAAVAEDLGGPGWNRGRFFHPHAYLGCGRTGEGGVNIGNGTHINYGVTMTRTTVGEFVTIAPGVTICGDVTIGDRVFIGAGAIIRNLVAIGDDAFICMGARVTRDVKPGERYKGRT